MSPIEKLLEPSAVGLVASLEGMTALSIAVSLKRIADALQDLDVTVDRHGDFTFRVERAINDGMRR